MQREQIDDLIVLLIAINNFSKDIHYTAHSGAFYAKHLLVDKFNFADSVDTLIECCLLGNDERPLPSKEYLRRASDITPAPALNNDKANFEKLRVVLINDALTTISKLEDLSKADENTIGGIAQDLQQYKGLINLQIEE